MNTAIYPKDHNNPPEGLDAIIAALREGRDVETELDQFEANVIGHDFDISTAKGRADVKSRAYDVSKMKGKTDAVGRELTADWKAKSKVVTSACASIRTRLDYIRDSIREPLTEYEDVLRAKLDHSLMTMNNLTDVQNLTSEFPCEQIETAYRFIKSIDVEKEVCEKFLEQAIETKAKSLNYLTKIGTDARQREKDQIELEELRAEKELRDQEAAKKLAEQEREREIEAAAQERVEAVKEQAELDILASIKKQDEHKITDAPRIVDGVVSEKHKPTIDNAIMTEFDRGLKNDHWPETYDEEPATLGEAGNETVFTYDIKKSLIRSFANIIGSSINDELVIYIVEEIMKRDIPHLKVV